jgi:hypothetical protein
MADPEYHVVKSPSDVVTLPGPGAIRFATGHPDGPRSLTWTVIGIRDKDDVYVGPRGNLMGAAKLSLHESGVWRIAFTQQGAEKVKLPEGEDRLIERFDATTELAPGWVLAARIRTPSTAFSSTISEKRPSDKRPIRFYKAPAPPHHLEYYVVLGDGAAKDAIVPATELINVGQMTLKSGKRVLIIANFWEMDAQTQHVIDLTKENAAKGAPGNTGFAMGNGDGVPTLLDLAAVKPPE